MRLELHRQRSASNAEKRRRYARLTPPNQSDCHTDVAFVVINVAYMRIEVVGYIRRRADTNEYSRKAQTPPVAEQAPCAKPSTTRRILLEAMQIMSVTQH